ncbi:uncharacterized protein LOC127723958 [Mytilus californianus]|uniref:uncharacterized protein LOC127723958 n=1 Tax=Mytilus californianus TaxID=6549 RepID=UPI002246872D|nr:uncharacterized protein LOC127723958 [Mytilus californianus]
METDSDYPGFSRLRLIAEDEENIYIPSECFESTPEGVYVSVNGFIDWIKAWQLQQLYRHGPCLSDKDQQIDLAFCLKSKYFPYQAIPWTIRHRYQWPPDNVVDRIANYGCLIVPIGPRTLSDSHLLWRISFSVAEKQLVHSFNFTQLLCYGLLKLTLKSIINTNDDVKDLLCSYFLKTALFWVSEEVDINTFQLSHLFICFTHCIKKLIVWVNNCYCPNYFIPEHNMFLGKITPDNNETLLHVLDSILFYGIDGLIDNLFPLGSTNSDISFIRLDFLFYKISVLAKKRDISNWYKLLKITEFLIKSESSAFIIDVCKYHFAKISQFVAQLLLPQTTNSEKYYLHKCHHRHLQDGIKSDAVSGWLLYASFYYVTGQYKVTLRITDYVLSRSTPDMVYITCSHYDENDIKNYRQNVHKSLNLNAKIKMATVDRTVYMHNSKLIPEELQLEVEKDGISVSPVIMSRFLRLLCYHHLGDILKRQQALRDLYLTVENCPLTKLEEISHSITILGVGYEVSGDKYTAYQCYDEALQCDDSICLSAQTRKSKLFEV